MARDALDGRVRTLIREMAVPNDKPGKYEMYEGKQAKVLAELEELGPSAVPFIIKYMDDRRDLPYRYLALSNEGIKGAFEAIRQYGPEKVVDALAGILNQLTGRSFGDIYNGGTEEERNIAVSEWRAWCTSQWPNMKDVCAGTPKQ